MAKEAPKHEVGKPADTASPADHKTVEASRSASMAAAPNITDQGATASDKALPQNPAIQTALSKIGQPMDPPRSPADVRQEGEEMVTVIIPPKGIKLILDGGVKVNIPGGTQNIPESLADHWYVKAHGARRHEMPNAHQTK